LKITNASLGGSIPEWRIETDCRRLNWPEEPGLQGNYLVQECSSTMKTTARQPCWTGRMEPNRRQELAHPSSHISALVSFSSSLNQHTTHFYCKQTWKKTWKYQKRSKTGRWQHL